LDAREQLSLKHLNLRNVTLTAQAFEFSFAEIETMILTQIPYTFLTTILYIISSMIMVIAVTMIAGRMRRIVTIQHIRESNWMAFLSHTRDKTSHYLFMLYLLLILTAVAHVVPLLVAKYAPLTENIISSVSNVQSNFSRSFDPIVYRTTHSYNMTTDEYFYKLLCEGIETCQYNSTASLTEIEYTPTVGKRIIPSFAAEPYNPIYSHIEWFDPGIDLDGNYGITLTSTGISFLSSSSVSLNMTATNSGWIGTAIVNTTHGVDYSTLLLGLWPDAYYGWNTSFPYANLYQIYSKSWNTFTGDIAYAAGLGAGYYPNVPNNITYSEATIGIKSTQVLYAKDYSYIWNSTYRSYGTAFTSSSGSFIQSQITSLDPKCNITLPETDLSLLPFSYVNATGIESIFYFYMSHDNATYDRYFCAVEIWYNQTYTSFVAGTIFNDIFEHTLGIGNITGIDDNSEPAAYWGVSDTGEPHTGAALYYIAEPAGGYTLDAITEWNNLFGHSNHFPATQQVDMNLFTVSQPSNYIVNTIQNSVMISTTQGIAIVASAIAIICFYGMLRLILMRYNHSISQVSVWDTIVRSIYSKTINANVEFNNQIITINNEELITRAFDEYKFETLVSQ
jgi:hypothetical protein